MEKHSLPKSKRESIREEEFDEEIDTLVSDLQGSQMNSEMKKAWVSRVIPNEDNTEVDIQFLLPSGLIGEEKESDTFVTTFTIPPNRFPDSLKFKQFIEELGCYDVGNLSEIIGEKVDIVYDEHKNQWIIDESMFLELEQETQTDPDESYEKQNKNSENEVSAVVSVLVATILSITFLLLGIRFLGVIGLFVGGGFALGVAILTLMQLKKI